MPSLVESQTPRRGTELYHSITRPATGKPVIVSLSIPTAIFELAISLSFPIVSSSSYFFFSYFFLAEAFLFPRYNRGFIFAKANQ